MVMEQFAKLSTGNRRRGSNPRLSASQGSKTSALRTGFFVSSRLIYSNESKAIERQAQRLYGMCNFCEGIILTKY